MRKGRVSIIDDDGAVRESLRMILARAGLDVVLYPSTQMFLSRVDGGDHGCLLLDQHMPKLDGLALLKEIRARGNNMPVVMMTGDSDPTLAERARRAGALTLLQKPFSPAELLGWIELALVEPKEG